MALSFYAARTALPVARVVPAELQDHSISQSPVKKLSYFGYEFEVPWSDLDESQTTLHPKTKPQFMVDLHFHSGLQLIVSAVPPENWVNGLAQDFKVPKQRITLNFGRSDYDVEKTILEFSPDNMHYWSLLPRVHYRDQFLLMIKSIAAMKSAETGIFNIRNQGFQGFQQGNPKQRPPSIYIHLFDKFGSIEFTLVGKDYSDPEGITQSQINRIVESLRRSAVGSAAIGENTNH